MTQVAEARAIQRRQEIQLGMEEDRVLVSLCDVVNEPYDNLTRMIKTE